MLGSPRVDTVLGLGLTSKNNNTTNAYFIRVVFSIIWYPDSGSVTIGFGSSTAQQRGLRACEVRNGKFSNQWSQKVVQNVVKLLVSN